MRAAIDWRLVAPLVLLPAAAHPHAFSTPYILPVPYWMYVYGTIATLMLTFALACLWHSSPQTTATAANASQMPKTFKVRWAAVLSLRIIAAAALIFTVAAGLIGSAAPSDSLAMSLFWAFFLVGFAYLTVLCGDLYAVVNPWSWAMDGLARINLMPSTLRDYPQWLGYWPALLQYAALIYVELFSPVTPVLQSMVLLAYSVVFVLGVLVFGKRAWLKYADPLSLFFRLFGILSPAEYKVGAYGDLLVQWRRPFQTAVSNEPGHMTALFFVLFILAATAYDSLHATALWIGLFWKNAVALFAPYWGADLRIAQEQLMRWYLIYQGAGLVVFAVGYYALFLLVCALTRILAGFKTMSAQALARRYSYALIPIAIAYHFTHYSPWLWTQLQSLPLLISNAFGSGWRWLDGPANVMAPPTLDMNFVWHMQVVVLILGHVISIFMTHRISQRLSVGDQALSALSQVPMLILMMGYTVSGLWILSIPIGEQ